MYQYLVQSCSGVYYRAAVSDTDISQVRSSVADLTCDILAWSLERGSTEVLRGRSNGSAVAAISGSAF